MTTEIKKALKKVELLERVQHKSEFLYNEYHQACHDAENLINSQGEVA